MELLRLREMVFLEVLEVVRWEVVFLLWYRAGVLGSGDVAEGTAKARRSGSGVLVMVRGAGAAAGSLLAGVDGGGVD